jgi:hypothetical protein
MRRAKCARWWNPSKRRTAASGRVQSLKSHLIYTVLDRMVHHPRILDAVENLLGPDILCLEAGESGCGRRGGRHREQWRADGSPGSGEGAAQAAQARRVVEVAGARVRLGYAGVQPADC